MRRIIAAIVVIAFCATGCGTANYFENDADKTPEQRAQELMNKGEYLDAVEILAPLVAEEPDVYERMPLLAAAYAGAAGLAILDLINAQVTAASSGNAEGSLFEQVSTFFPETYGRTELNYVDTAVKTLNLIPAAFRAGDGATPYGDSAAFQLTLYTMLYSMMYLNLFVTFNGGQIDPSRLSTMTDADAAAILAALAAAAANGVPGQSAEVSAAAAEALAEIAASPGGSDRERLQNFAGQQGGG